MLKFSRANTKTKKLAEVESLASYLQDGRKVYSLDLSAGYSCPGAKQCLSRVVCEQGRHIIQDGPHCEFRCFSASQEVVFPHTRIARRHNFDLIRRARGQRQILSLLASSLPEDAGIVRYHVGGDFFKLAYLEAAWRLANSRPHILFYGYTKSLKFLLDLPMYNPGLGIFNPYGNFLLTASYGGKYDELIESLGVRSATVVFSESEAGNLPIDNDDSHAATIGDSFALLIHGIQPKGSRASKALWALKK